MKGDEVKVGNGRKEKCGEEGEEGIKKDDRNGIEVIWKGKEESRKEQKGKGRGREGEERWNDNRKGRGEV